MLGMGRVNRTGFAEGSSFDKEQSDKSIFSGGALILKPRVLNFHGIGTPALSVDPGERLYWIDTDLFTDVIEYFPVWNRQRPLYITFDDGNLSDLEIAAPILAARGLPARFFILTGRLETPGYLSAKDVIELHKMGFIIGSHGHNHVDWSTLSPNRLDEELRHSRARLSDILNLPITEAAIPFGNYNRAVLQALKATGYKTAWTSDGGGMNPNAFLRPRTSIKGDMTIETVRDILLSRATPAREFRRTLAKIRKSVL